MTDLFDVSPDLFKWLDDNAFERMDYIASDAGENKYRPYRPVVDFDDVEAKLLELVLERDALAKKVKDLILDVAGRDAVIKELQSDIRYYRKEWKDQMIQDQGNKDDE